MSGFWKGVWAELNGSAQHRRDFLRIKEIVLRDIVAQIQVRLGFVAPPGNTLDYDEGWYDAINAVLELIDPDTKKGKDDGQHPEPR